MTFVEPWWLALLLFLIPIWGREVFGGRAALRFSALRLGNFGRDWRAELLARLPLLLRSLVLVCLAIAMARPQEGASEVKRTSEGIDIMLTVDTSGSMRAVDFKVKEEAVDRLEAVKHVLREFIQERPDDRMGMVIFGSEAFTQAPLTLDHDVLLQFLEKTRIGMAGESTAIGSAIATAANRIKELEAKSRVIVLLTDGENSAGEIQPLQAAEAAAQFGIKIYTIAVGRSGLVPFPGRDFFGRTRLMTQRLNVDTESLKKIAAVTGGEFYQAYDTDSLREIYTKIDDLEKKKVEVQEFREYHDVFAIFLWPGLLLLVLESLFGLTPWRRLT